MLLKKIDNSLLRFGIGVAHFESFWSKFLGQQHTRLILTHQAARCQSFKVASIQASQSVQNNIYLEPGQNDEPGCAKKASSSAELLRPNA